VTSPLSGRSSGLQAGKFYVGGNIGDPLIGYVDSPPGRGLAVVRVKQLQLEWIEQFRPMVALLLNVTCDHIDYHGTLRGLPEGEGKNL